MIKETKLPTGVIWAVIVISVLPFLLNLFGVNFGSPKPSLKLSYLAEIETHKVVDVIHQSLAGSFTHTILEWSAFCTAIFTVILSLIHFQVKRDIITLLVGIALFFAGCMDAFHTLAADRLIQGVADTQNLVNFSWAICRLFNALILICGVGIFLITKPKQWQGNFAFVIVASVCFGFVAYGIIHLCATSAHLPQTVFPNSPISRPWDIVPLVLFMFAGTLVFPLFYQQYPSIFSHALIVGTIPSVITQMHMAFGSTALFDNHFNIGHFLKIVAYLVPFAGLSLDYIQTYRQEAVVLATLGTSARLLSTTIEQQEQIAIQQATAVSQTTTTIDELRASSQQSAQQAETSAASARQALTLAESGRQALGQAMGEMTALNEQVTAIAMAISCLNEQINQIGNISSLVTDFANQTNILSLNAAVEAARAGDQGKGFGVVAKEIRQLAVQSKQSAQQINSLAADIQNAIKTTVAATGEGTKTVEKSVNTAQKTTETFISVADAVNAIATNTQQISLNNNQQALAIQQLADAMNTLKVGATQTASGISETKIGLQQVNTVLMRLSD